MRNNQANNVIGTTSTLLSENKYDSSAPENILGTKRNPPLRNIHICLFFHLGFLSSAGAQGVVSPAPQTLVQSRSAFSLYFHPITSILDRNLPHHPNKSCEVHMVSQKRQGKNGAASPYFGLTFKPQSCVQEW
jgi:hypothetical protein